MAQNENIHLATIGLSLYIEGKDINQAFQHILEYNPPVVKAIYQTIESSTVGGKAEIPVTGQYDIIEADFTLQGDVTEMDMLAKDDGYIFKFKTVRDELDQETGKKTGLITEEETIEGFIKSVEKGTKKRGEQLTTKVTLSVFSYEQKKADQLIFKVDKLRGIVRLKDRNISDEIRESLAF